MENNNSNNKKQIPFKFDSRYVFSDTQTRILRIISDEKSIEKVGDYLTHFNGVAPADIEKPLTQNEMKNLTDEWSANFVDKLTMEELVNLTVAANHMGINCLLDLCCAKIASMCKDKSEEEVLKTFGINEAFTEEDKKKIKEENKWIEENL